MAGVPQCQRTFFSDHNDGKDAERASLPFLRQLSKSPLIHVADEKAPWDFESESVVMEHKNRFIDSGAYPDVMIKYLKVERAMVSKRKVFFIFRYTDGLFYIKYDKALFATFRTDEKKIKDRVDYIEKVEKRIYIPRKFLKCLVRFRAKPLFLDEE